MDAEFVHMTCFGHWNILEEMMQAGALHVLIVLPRILVILLSAMRGAVNLGNSWFQNEKRGKGLDLTPRMKQGHLS